MYYLKLKMTIYITIILQVLCVHVICINNSLICGVADNLLSLHFEIHQALCIVIFTNLYTCRVRFVLYFCYFHFIFRYIISRFFF